MLCGFANGCSYMSLWFKYILKKILIIYFQSEWNFNMIHLIAPSYIPPNYLGKWRFTQISEFVVDNNVKTECVRTYADLLDE